ncbi:hypothetical protein ABIA39_000319 [Nocardia sp. GAS34]|uniref:hypothetical protein n=1 Tax=unclassified Nocardia TaxID=2637762 RepID=UPI003D191552
MPRDLADVAVGELWAYRQRGTDPVTCVEVLRLGTAKPPRVLVKFTDNRFEGRSEWVPPARLKVPWDQAEEWLAREERWATLRDGSEYIRGTTEHHALDMLEDDLPGYDLVEFLYNSNAGILRIHDVDALAEDLGLDREFIVGDPASFVVDDDGSLLVPWRVTQVIAKSLARKFADVVVAQIEQREEEARRHNQWGYASSTGWISAEICAEVDQEFAPARELVRQWCGADARDRYDELLALRAEVYRLGALIERAVTALRSSGNDRDAEAIERDLGIPLEAVRQAHQRDSAHQ